MMLLFPSYFILLLFKVSFTVSATQPASDTQIQQVNLPTTSVLDGLANSSVAVQVVNQIVSDGRDVACFVQRKLPRERLRHIDYMDCYFDMARGLLVGDDVMMPKRYTEHGRPFAWNAGTCMIIIDQIGADAPLIQTAEIAHIAALVTRFCVVRKVQGEPLGGQTIMGEGDAYTLSVYGRREPS